jgi:hypothetical protein
MDAQVIIPSPRGSEGYVELAASATRQALGTVFRKHILTLGPLTHPKTGQRLDLDDSFYSRLKANFDAGACDIVQVPLADAQNRHTEHPLSNTGEVIGIERDGQKVYSVIDVRDPDIAQRIRDKRLLGASAFLHLDYKDTATNRNVGPTLLHHCITNRPYVTGLDPYEEVIAATADGEGDVIVLAQEEADMPTKDELLEQLKAEHGIDVTALQAQADQGANVQQLTAALTAALQPAAAAGQVKLTSADGQTLELSDIVGAVAELAHQHQAFGSRVVTLERDKAEREIDGYISTGRVLPKQREAFVTMALTNRDQMEVLLPDEPVVQLNNQRGHIGTPQGEQKQQIDIDQEILRLTAENPQVFNASAQRDPRQRVNAANHALLNGSPAN